MSLFLGYALLTYKLKTKIIETQILSSPYCSIHPNSAEQRKI